MDPELELGIVSVDFPWSGGLGFDFRLRKSIDNGYRLRITHGHYETGGVIGELEFKLNLEQIKELGEMFLRSFFEEIKKKANKKK